MASGRIQRGDFAGAALGPVLFGLVATANGYPAAWRAGAGLMIASAALLVMARRMFIVDRRRRPQRTSPLIGETEDQVRAAQRQLGRNGIDPRPQPD